jgi:hypothetical protein
MYLIPTMLLGQPGFPVRLCRSVGVLAEWALLGSLESKNSKKPELVTHLRLVCWHPFLGFKQKKVETLTSATVRFFCKKKFEINFRKLRASKGNTAGRENNRCKLFELKQKNK